MSIITRRLVLFTQLIVIAALIAGLFGWQPTPAAAACQISGIVYRDYNANGQQDELEPGLRRVVVVAYGQNNVELARTQTLAGGVYTLNITADVDQVRVEFVDYPAYVRSGPFGTGNSSTTTVTFVDCSQPTTTDINFGVNNPGQFCHSSPLLATSCYVLGAPGEPRNAAEAAVVSFAYDAGQAVIPGAPVNPADYDDTIIYEALIPQVGSTWGTAYHRVTDSYFTMSLVKRHTGLGPAGTGGLYVIRNISDNNAPGGGNVQLFLNMDDYFPADAPVAGTTGRPADAYTSDDVYFTDPAAYAAVGKVGWGDLEVDDNDGTLFAVNLFDRRLYLIPIEYENGAAGYSPVPPDPGRITRYDIPNPCTYNAPASLDDMRPWATKYRDGMLYIGLICSAQSTQNRDNLRGYVYAFDPLTTAFNPTPVLDFALDYPRTCVNDFVMPAPCEGRATDPAITPFNPQGDGDWLPWLDVYPFSEAVATGNGSVQDVAYPQPMLTDIEFDNDDMILSFRDRFPDQQGDNLARAPYDPNGTQTLYNARGGGDILRACFDEATETFTLESGATCGPVTTDGAVESPGQGPGGAEYYYGETFSNSHDEIVIGGLAQIPGRRNVVTSVFDPIPVPFPPLSAAFENALFDGGVRWLRNTPINGDLIEAGDVARALRIYDGNNQQQGDFSNQALFGKANGLGDMEALCGPATLEIGNRVWVDLGGDIPQDALPNGIQDPRNATEFPLAGVVVTLYYLNDFEADPATAQPLARAVTNANGEYYFRGPDRGLLAVPSDYPTADPNPNDEFGIVLDFFDINGDRALVPYPSNNEPAGILPNTRYIIRLDAPENYSGGPLDGYRATTPDVADGVPLSDQRDSDGIVQEFEALVGLDNIPEIRLMTGDFGENDHTFDFGFTVRIEDRIPSLTPSPTPTETPTATETGVTGTPGTPSGTPPTETPFGTPPLETPSGTPPTETPFGTPPPETPFGTPGTTPSVTPFGTPGPTPTLPVTRLPDTGESPDGRALIFLLVLAGAAGFASWMAFRNREA